MAPPFGGREMSTAALDLPTPVFELRRGLWVKDESAIGGPYGGNKVRKLGRILGEVLERGHQAVVTSGSAGSHHVLATALYADALGLDTHAVLFPEPRTDDAVRHASAIAASCRSITAVGDASQVVAAAHRIATIHDAWVIPVGGSSVTGTLGWVDGARELADQVAAGALPAPRTVWVPSASGGTAAGLALGLAEAGLDSRVIAVRVRGNFLTRRRLDALVRRTARRMGRQPPPIDLVEPCPGSRPPVDWDAGYVVPALTTCLARSTTDDGPHLFVRTDARALPTQCLPETMQALLG